MFLLQSLVGRDATQKDARKMGLQKNILFCFPITTINDIPILIKLIIAAGN
jgi:hypothetical protein